jgi:hypothetical protein
MVSEGKEQALQHLSKADLAFIAILLDVQDSATDDPDKTRSTYRLTFENIQMVHGQLSRTEDGMSFHYEQSSKGLNFKLEGKTEHQAAVADDEVKVPKEGKTYVAILTNPEHISVLVEINPHEINEILRSTRVSI